MSRAEAAARHDAEIIAAKPSYYDPIDDITTILPPGQVRLRLLSNLLYGQGYRVVNAAKNILFGMHEHARDTGNVDSFNTFLAFFSECETNAQYAVDLGYDHHSTGVHKLRAQISLFNQWRDVCYAEAKAIGTKFTPPELHALLNEAPKYDASEVEKATTIATLTAKEIGASFEDTQQMRAIAAQKAAEDHKAKVVQTKVIAPHLERIVVECGDVDTIQFYELPLADQAAIIRSASKSAAKMPSMLIKMKSVTTMDCIISVPLLQSLQRKLDDVLSDARFDEYNMGV